jgi:hypothetical protein
MRRRLSRTARLVHRVLRRIAHVGRGTAGFRNWSELEDKATCLRAWSPGIIHGLLQTEDYAAALLATMPGASEETVTSRLRARMERQRRVISRDTPPAAWFVVDEMALYRPVGSPAIMATQMRQIAALAALPDVTVQILPAIAHPATASGFVIADDSAWCEHVAGGFVYTDQTVTSLLRLFDSLRAECYRASESAALTERVCGLWANGASPLTAGPNGGDCVEVASADVVMIRDTRDRNGAVLAVTAEAWQRFIVSLK